MLDAAQLLKIVPRVKGEAEKIVTAINSAMEGAEINTPLRACHFIAQIAHETDGFKHFKEIGNNDYFRRYDNKVNLGNSLPGDGARYKGRGFIQITGKVNYAKASKELGLDLVNNPELAETLEIGARIAAWYWSSRNLNVYADKDDITSVTKRINNNILGLEEIVVYYNKAKSVIK